MHSLCPQAMPMSPSPQTMLPKRLGTLVSTRIHTLDSGILTKHDKVHARPCPTPLALPGDTSIGVANFKMLNNENGRANRGYDDNSLAKGNGKRLERSKSFSV